MNAAYNKSPLTATEAARQPQIAEQLAQLDRSLKVLREGIDSLANRLNPVSQPKPRDPEKDSIKHPEVTLCPVGDQIRSARREIEAVSASVTDLMDNLEV